MKEVRICEVRAADPAGSKALIIEGMPIVYGATTSINDTAGSYKEVIERGALDHADLSDVHLFYNHDLNRVPLARVPRTLDLQVTETGLRMRATLPDTEQAREVYQAIQRGDLSGLSFAFVVPDGGDSYDAATNTRTIHLIRKVYEVSVVPFPAYPQTSVEARNALSAAQSGYKARQDCRILINQILKVR